MGKIVCGKYAVAAVILRDRWGDMKYTKYSMCCVYILLNTSGKIAETELTVTIWMWRREYLFDVRGREQLDLYINLHRFWEENLIESIINILRENQGGLFLIQDCLGILVLNIWYCRRCITIFPFSSSYHYFCISTNMMITTIQWK